MINQFKGNQIFSPDTGDSIIFLKKIKAVETTCPAIDCLSS